MNKTYTKSEHWKQTRIAMNIRRRKKNAKRNVQIYRDMTENYNPLEWRKVAAKHHLTRQRLHQIKKQVQLMIQNNEIDISPFTY